MGGSRSNRIAEAREKAGLTQQQAADLLGVSVQGYQYYEYGKRDPKASVIRRLCEIFGASAAYLLGMTSESGVRFSAPPPYENGPRPRFRRWGPCFAG